MANKVKLQSPKKEIGAVSVNGNEYTVDKDGFVSVEVEDVKQVQEWGFTEVVEEEKATPKKTK